MLSPSASTPTESPKNPTETGPKQPLRASQIPKTNPFPAKQTHETFWPIWQCNQMQFSHIHKRTWPKSLALFCQKHIIRVSSPLPIFVTSW